MATGGGANLAIGGGDPRLAVKGDEKFGGMGGEGITSYSRPQMRAMHNSSITFEEYEYWAQQARIEEDETQTTEPKIGIMGMLFPSKNNKSIADENAHRRDSTTIGMPTEQKNGGEVYSETTRIDVSDDEWLNAQRAVRTASGAACFYLITTDILGPFGLPFSFGTVGWVPGVVLFTIFAVLAGYSGYLMNTMFLGTDSFRYPARAYGDVAFRIYGNWGRIPVNILQALQLILTVSLITITNGQALSVISRFKLCYVVCIVILVAVGGVIGQIRTLQKFGWLANVAVFFNVFIMIFTMAVAAHSGPNLGAAGLLSSGAALGDGSTTPVHGVYPPVTHHIGLPVTGNFIGALNGAMNTVFAYGGANVFYEFMAEMKRPRDFLKAMWAAQFFIWFVYMFYGLFMYGFQGQYSVSPSPVTISPYWALVIANIFYILSAGIAACLYGNIGLKVIYNNIFIEFFGAPTLVTKKGKFLWIIMIPIYWTIAFVIGASIPDFNALVGVVGALCIVQFTYSFPPIFHVGYMLQHKSILPGEEFNPTTGETPRSGGLIQRWSRAFSNQTGFEKAMMCWNVIYALAALALGGLGAFASFTGIIDSFKSPQVNAFSCKSPLDFVKI